MRQGMGFYCLFFYEVGTHPTPSLSAVFSRLAVAYGSTWYPRVLAAERVAFSAPHPLMITLLLIKDSGADKDAGAERQGHA